MLHFFPVPEKNGNRTEPNEAMKRNSKTGRLESNGLGEVRHKRLLQARGWSYREFCREYDYSVSHLAAVIGGHRVSTTLLKKIEALPNRRKGAAQ